MVTEATSSSTSGRSVLEAALIAGSRSPSTSLVRPEPRRQHGRDSPGSPPGPQGSLGFLLGLLVPPGFVH